MNNLQLLFKWSLAIGTHINPGFIRAVSKIYKTYLIKSRQDPLLSEIRAIEELYNLVKRYLPKEEKRNKYQAALSPGILSFLSACEETLFRMQEDYKKLQLEEDDYDYVPSIHAPMSSNDITVIPYEGLHPKLKRSDLHENGKLYSTKQMTAVEATLKNQANGTAVKLGKYKVYKINNENYALYTELGAGNFGSVYLAQELRTGKLCVIKNIRLPNDSLVRMVKREVSVLQAINSNVDAAFGNESAQFSMDLVVGTPMDHLLYRQEKGITWLRRILSMLEAVKELHDKNIVHRDLKLENMLCSSDDKVSVIDMGLARILNPGVESTRFTDVMPRLYADAPEVQLGIFGLYTDRFVLGKVLFEFMGTDDVNEIATLLGVPVQFAEQFKRVISNLSAHDPQDRSTLEECIKVTKLLLSEHLEIIYQFKKIGLVSADDCEEILKEPKQLEALKLMDKVYIQLSADYPSADRRALMTRLSKEGVRVAGFVNSNLYLKENSLISIRNFLERNSQPTDINSYYYFSYQNTLNATGRAKLSENSITPIQISEKKTKAAYKREIENTPQLNLNHYMIMISGLQDELDRLYQKYESTAGKSSTNKILSERKNVLEIAIETLSTAYATDSLTYAQALNYLTNLEAQMQHANKAKRFFANLFGMKHETEGAKNIAKIREDLQSKVVYTKAKK